MDEFQGHDSPLVRIWAVGIIDQLWMKGEIEPGEGRRFVELALDDADPRVRAQAEQLLEMWEREASLSGSSRE